MTFGTMLLRAARLRCPVCGRGALFRSYFARAERCSKCRWRYERGEGHWVGGSEVHMFVSYFLSAFLCIPALVLFGSTVEVMVGIACAHVALSLVIFRFARAVFLGVDVYLDPSRPPPPDDDDGRDPIRPRTPPSRSRRRGPARADSARHVRVERIDDSRRPVSLD